MKTRIATIMHRSVRRKYRHVMALDGVKISVGQYQTRIEGPDDKVAVVARKLPKWLADGMIEGTPINGRNKGPAYQ